MHDSRPFQKKNRKKSLHLSPTPFQVPYFSMSHRYTHVYA
jgi:hypothetical protein